MATVTKDFRVKSGLVVEGANGTINGSDIITEDKLAGGNQSGISVTYNTQTGNVDFDVSDPEISISGDASGESTMTDLGSTDIEITLATVNQDVGTFGSSTAIPVITVNGKGLITAVETESISTTLAIAGDTGTDSIALATDTLTFAGGEGMDVSVTSNTNTVTIAGEDASTSNKGIASFADANFTVTNGAVSAKSATVGTSTVTLGSTTLSLAGLESVAVDNITIDGNSISSTDTNGNINLNPNGTGVVDVNTSRITNVAEPQNASDAATKSYVDAVSEGLHIHPSVVAATTENINISNDLMVGDLIDGVTLAATNRVLVKNQNTASENGIYVVQSSGAAIRATDFDQPNEVDGGDFVFVTGGDTQDNTGWVQTADSVVVIGTDPIYFTQFSGAGTYLAGNGLTLDGNTFEIDDTIVVTETDLDTAVTSLETYIDGFLDPSTGTTIEYIDDQDAATLLAANTYTDTLVETGDATASPQYLALNVNDVALQVAATVSAPTAGTPVVAYSFAKAAYKTAKFLVKVAYGTHTEVSEVLLTLDTSDNIAITEYAVVSTNGSASTITAAINGTSVELRVTPTNNTSTVRVMGTLIV